VEASDGQSGRTVAVGKVTRGDFKQWSLWPHTASVCDVSRAGVSVYQELVTRGGRAITGVGSAK